MNFSKFFWDIFNLSLNFADMIELAQHIETLLLENDCVIVPGFGGFVRIIRPQPVVKERKIYFYLLPVQSVLILN